ncbi:MAG TPA: molybdopterin-dependent oxidoreductase [Nocardioides sp.]|uniref:molybdopterin-dependent oxidoreductase n=1 Tax=Nocardioides sp. TaxID=35761 RepID=UPI002E328FFD|nr:molybdopterin-dependent oxidoreductase [Nocardioides sp.]HEX3931078.1 molybdopterin-dependent oxidoreductase [Nocardioides sp.]
MKLAAPPRPRRIPQEDDFTSWLRSPAVTARIGVWLGVTFGLAFVTGVISHWAQTPAPWLPFPTSPSWGYRVTQGVHVISGTAAVPLLLVKLWTVFPKLVARPPKSLGALLAHGLERISIGVLVASAIFQLASGLANSAQWYPWHFHFRATHYAVAWIAIGSLLVHIAVKLPIVRAAFAADVDDTAQDRPGMAAGPGVLTRRGLLRTTWTAAGVAVLATAGATVPWLRHVSVLAVRSGTGPGGVPINHTAAERGVVSSATSAAYRLVVAYDGRETSYTLAELRAMPQATASLPIACVEGWSAGATWTGVPVRDLLARAGAPARSQVIVRSLQSSGGERYSYLAPNFTEDPRTLLALRLHGEPLSLDHGFPCRLIAPDRPGVLQTKWVGRLEVTR